MIVCSGNVPFVVDLVYQRNNHSRCGNPNIKDHENTGPRGLTSSMVYLVMSFAVWYQPTVSTLAQHV